MTQFTADGWVSSRGERFSQFWDAAGIPALQTVCTEFEAFYDLHPVLDAVKASDAVPVVIVAAYIAFVFGGARYMKRREAFDLRYTLAAWNLFLSVFSFIGAARTVPHLLVRIATMPYQQTICETARLAWGNGCTGLWVQLFILSKIPELFDTFFLVVRKRDVNFLHWYHHVSVLLYSWHAYSTEASQALYFIAMNYTVHAVMYGYYCLMALKWRRPLKMINPVYITALQISQMVVGVIVQISTMYYYYNTGDRCSVNFSNMVLGAVMYASYLALFLQFAVQRYCSKRATKPDNSSKLSGSNTTVSEGQTNAAETADARAAVPLETQRSDDGKPEIVRLRKRDAQVVMMGGA